MKKLLLVVLLSITLLSITITSVYADNKSSGTTNQQPVTNQWHGEKVDGIDYILVFSPIGLFILSVCVINYKTRDFKLGDALTENEYPTETIPNPLCTTANFGLVAAAPSLASSLTPTITQTVTVNGFPKSSSRYLALITGCLTLIVASCLASAYIYIYLSSGIQPEVNHLGDVLIALGIGITPYAVNKVSTAVSSKQN